MIRFLLRENRFLSQDSANLRKVLRSFYRSNVPPCERKKRSQDPAKALREIFGWKNFQICLRRNFGSKFHEKKSFPSSNKATIAQGSVLGKETMEENQGENGVKGTRKFWNSGEIAAAALSFLQVSEDPVVGVNQSGGRFHARLVEALVKKPLFLFQSFNQRVV